jgi:hypothetical protein
MVLAAFMVLGSFGLLSIVSDYTVIIIDIFLPEFPHASALSGWSKI